MKTSPQSFSTEEKTFKKHQSSKIRTTSSHPCRAKESINLLLRDKSLSPTILKTGLDCYGKKHYPSYLTHTISLIRSTLIEQPAHDIFQKKTVAYQEREHLPFH